LLFELNDAELRKRDQELVRLTWKLTAWFGGAIFVAGAVLGTMFGKAGAYVALPGLGAYAVMLGVMHWKRLVLFKKDRDLIRERMTSKGSS
jgi:hypothetical protein